MKEEKIYSISIIRVISMFSIIVGHFLTMIGINHMQYGAIGVEIFLFMSGWLYSKKNIKSQNEWLRKKWVKIVLPVWIMYIFLFLLKIVFKKNIELISVLFYLFNIQGINKIFHYVTVPNFSGLGHTWFVTIIMICYLIMLLIKKNKTIEESIVNNKIKYLLGSIIVQFILAFFGIQIINILCFFYGYFWNQKQLKQKKKYIVLTLLMIALTILRLIFYIYFDGKIIYDRIILRYSFIVLGIWIFTSLSIACNKYSHITHTIAKSKTWALLDILSYHLFLTHYFLMNGDFALNKITNNIVILFSTIIVLSFLLSLLLSILFNFRGVKQVFQRKKGVELI